MLPDTSHYNFRVKLQVSQSVSTLSYKIFKVLSSLGKYSYTKKKTQFLKDPAPGGLKLFKAQEKYTKENLNCAKSSQWSKTTLLIFHSAAG